MSYAAEMSLFGRRNVYRWPGPHIVLPARASLTKSANAKMIERFHWAHGRQLREAPGAIAEEGKDI